MAELRTLEFWDAFTTGYIEGLIFETFEVYESQNLVFWTKSHKNGWALNFEWTVGYEKGASGTWDSPPEDNNDVTDSQAFYFTMNESPIKVMKEIRNQLETISELLDPEDNEIEYELEYEPFED